MVVYRALMLDLDPTPCPTGDCGRLPEAIKRLVPHLEMHVETTAETRGITVPNLILVRPSPTAEVHHFRRFKERWHHVSMLGVFCSGSSAPTHVLDSLVPVLEDFISCPFREIDLFRRIRRMLSATRGQRTNSCPATPEARAVESLVGESPCFLDVISKVALLAHADATVLVSGETGTGKELVARAIHYQSRRRGQPFIPVNCGALPDHLVENELFGHAKGAFTDAGSAEKGLIAEAEGGTLFLDEVDALSAPAQVKLLRFLQDREFRPLGSTRSTVGNVRVVAATNSDLKQRVEANLFRADLYHRINVLSLSLPPLRQRVSDIPLLASHFLRRYGDQDGRGLLSMESGALQKLLDYPWPGNVRELDAAIQRAVILSSSEVLQADDFDLALPVEARPGDGASLHAAKIQVIEEFEKAYLTRALSLHRGNISHVAKAVGTERRALRRLLQKYGLRRDVFADTARTQVRHE